MSRECQMSEKTPELVAREIFDPQQAGLNPTAAECARHRAIKSAMMAVILKGIDESLLVRNER